MILRSMKGESYLSAIKGVLWEAKRSHFSGDSKSMIYFPSQLTTVRRRKMATRMEGTKNENPHVSESPSVYLLSGRYHRPWRRSLQLKPS